MDREARAYRRIASVYSPRTTWSRASDGRDWACPRVVTDTGSPGWVRRNCLAAIPSRNRGARGTCPGSAQVLLFPARLAALQFVAPDERAPLDDVVRAFVADAFAGAKGDARNEYVDVMRSRSAQWWKDPWLTVLPYDGNLPPVTILVENQGSTHDGGIYDDPADDTEYEKWRNGITSWNVDFLRDNPPAQLYRTVETAATTAVETAGAVASGANEAAKGVARILEWAPYMAAGMGMIGLTAVVLAAAHARPDRSAGS